MFTTLLIVLVSVVVGVGLGSIGLPTIRLGLVFLLPRVIGEPMLDGIEEAHLYQGAMIDRFADWIERRFENPGNDAD